MEVWSASAEKQASASGGLRMFFEHPRNGAEINRFQPFRDQQVYKSFNILSI